jgi:hypothetical protein
LLAVKAAERQLTAAVAAKVAVCVKLDVFLHEINKMLGHKVGRVGNG